MSVVDTSQTCFNSFLISILTSVPPHHNSTTSPCNCPLTNTVKEMSPHVPGWRQNSWGDQSRLPGNLPYTHNDRQSRPNKPDARNQHEGGSTVEETRRHIRLCLTLIVLIQATCWTLILLDLFSPGKPQLLLRSTISVMGRTSDTLLRIVARQPLIRYTS